MADLRSILDLIKSKETSWARVNAQPCMHTFIDDFYINICLYNLDDKKVISINVDDVNKGIYDLLAEDLTEGDKFFNDLYLLYKSSKDSARNIALQH